MILTVPSKQLLAAIRTVSHACASRTPQEILRMVRVVVTASGMTFEATDHEVGVRHVADFSATNYAEFMLDPSKLASILSLVDGDVTLAVKNKQITLETDHSEYQLPWVDPDGFPSIADETAFSHTVDAEMFRYRLKRTLIAASREEAKYAVSGVLINLAGSDYSLVATNGKTLALSNKSDSEHSAIIPFRACQLMLDNGYEGDAMLSLRTGEANQFTIRTGPTTLTTRLLEGSFPPWKSVIPKASKRVATVAVGALLSAVKQAAVMTDDESKKVVCLWESGKVTLHAQGTTTGKSRVVCKLAEYMGESLKITINPDYLLSMLPLLDDDDVLTVKLGDEKTPLVIERGEYLYLVVPMV